jgi:lysophospholipase L1-like esterase
VTRRRVLLVALGTIAVPVLLLGVLVVEVELARNGPDLPDRDPYDLDGVVNHGRPGPTERVVWLGDSTAAGVGASRPDQALPRQVAAATGHPVDLTVLAVSGARVSDVVRHQLPHVPAHVDTVFVSVGSNDAVHLTRVGDFRRQYEHLLAGLPSGARVVLLGVPDLGALPRFAQPLRFLAGVRGGTLDAVIHHLAGHPGRSYVDIAGETGPAFRRDPSGLFAADDYHPDDAGYALWAKAVTSVVAIHQEATS